MADLLNKVNRRIFMLEDLKIMSYHKNNQIEEYRDMLREIKTIENLTPQEL